MQRVMTQIKVTLVALTSLAGALSLAATASYIDAPWLATRDARAIWATLGAGLALGTVAALLAMLKRHVRLYRGERATVVHIGRWRAMVTRTKAKARRVPHVGELSNRPRLVTWATTDHMGAGARLTIAIAGD